MSAAENSSAFLGFCKLGERRVHASTNNFVVAPEQLFYVFSTQPLDEPKQTPTIDHE
jgi:hypothetical protein